MRTSRTLRKRGVDFFRPSWLFGQKQPQTPVVINWNTATVNPIKKDTNSYSLRRGKGARHLIPTRHQAYGGPGILTKRNNSTQKAQKPKKGITFNPELYVGNFSGPTLPRAENSNNTTRHFRGRKNGYNTVYNNVPNETLWSNPNNWARSQDEVVGDPNDPVHTFEPLNGTPALPYPVDERNIASFFATAQLYKNSKLSNLSKLNQFAKKNKSRRNLIKNTAVQMAIHKLNLRKLAEQAEARAQAHKVQVKAQQDNLNPDIMWSE